MTVKSDIAAHYASGDLLDRLRAALAEDGADPDRPTAADLAPYDQFHGRGLDATEEVANLLAVSPSDHLLDVGCGIGGPARYCADRFGCRVTGIDLTAEFCHVARHLNACLGMEDKVAIHQGDALAMPFPEAAFDGAYSMNVSMNIADKAGFYRAIHHVLRPGGWLVLSELAKGPGGHVAFPAPWARDAASSFLATPEDTRCGLKDAGFVIERSLDRTAASRAFAARSRAAVERGEKPPHRAVALIHGEDNARAMAANVTQGQADEATLPIELHCRKTG